MYAYSLRALEENVMRHASYMLYIACAVEKNGFTIDNVHFVKNINDSFLTFAFMLVVNGIDPSTLCLILNNFIKYENDYINKTKMEIQVSAILAMQHKNPFVNSCKAISTYTNACFFDKLNLNIHKYLNEKEVRLVLEFINKYCSI